MAKPGPIKKRKQAQAKRTVKAGVIKKRPQGKRTLAKRKKLAKKLRGAIERDKKKLWGVTSNANLDILYFYLGDIKKEIEKRIPKDRSLRVMDLGCGGGYALKELAQMFGSKVELTGTGVTKNPEWKTPFAETDKNIKWRIAHAENLAQKFPANHFDLIYSNLALSHASDIRKSLMNIKKVLRKGGIAIFNLSQNKKLPKIAGLKEVKMGAGGMNLLVYYMKKV